MKHTIGVLVENEFGVLARVAGLFSGRGYNIQSLTVAETVNPSISRMTIVTDGDDHMIEQIVKQVGKLISVIKIQDMTAEETIDRILALAKIKWDARKGAILLKKIKALKGRILEKDKVCVVAEFTGNEENLNKVLVTLKPFGVLEFEKTGTIAIERSGK